MSEASSRFRRPAGARGHPSQAKSPQPGSARGHPSQASPRRGPLGGERRTKERPSRGSTGAAVEHDGQHAPATSSPFLDEFSYPLDPPLVDVRIPVKAPHATATVYSREGLMLHFPDAEVGDDLHMLFTEPPTECDGVRPAGNEPGEEGRSRLSPDVLVALNVPRRGTRSDYDADLLGPPDFVLEVLSASTWKHDLGRKLDCYQGIGVRECLLFDATGADFARTGKELWGFAMTPESREPLEEVTLPNGERGVHSAVLGLTAYIAKRTPPAASRETWELTMRWHDPATAKDIPNLKQSQAEVCAQRDRADAEAREKQAERDRADVAEREKQAERDRADMERDRADMEAHEKQAERDRANAERDRADAMARRVAELEEQLRLRTEE